MHPILFKIGPFTVYTYGFFVFLGVLCAYFVCLKEARRQNLGKAVFSDIIFWTLAFSFIGARIFYVSVEFKEFLQNPIGILFGRSGFVFYGGVVFGVIVLYVLARIYKVSFLKLADIIALGVPLAHAFGRLGCFSYGCCYGRPTNSVFGVLFPPESPAGSLGVKVIPTQLIAAFSLFLVFFILLFFKKYKKVDGQILVLYLVLYSVLRFIVEFFRGDPRGGIGFLSLSQFISIVAITFALGLWLKIRPVRNNKNS